MASSNADWVLGGAGDFVGKQTLPKIGPWTKVHITMARRHVFLNDVGAGNVGGIRSRCELDARKSTERFRDRTHHECLCRTGKPCDQAMSADKQRREDLIQGTSSCRR